MTYPDAQAAPTVWRPIRDELESVRDMALLERRAFQRVAERMAAGQTGECFAGLD